MVDGEAMADSSFQRLIPLQGCFNFRDLGGYSAGDGLTVKWRRLFRSDAVHLMTPEDVDHVQDELGVVTVVDLRNPEEVQRDGRGGMSNSSVQYHHVPFLGGRTIAPPGPLEDPVARLTEIYLWILRNSGIRIAETLNTLAEARNSPAVFHCTAGKDRAGILATLVLGVLGVDDEQIMDDYRLTNRTMDQLSERLRARPGNEHRSRESFEAHPEAMEHALAEVHEVYGDASNYARAHGVSDAAIDRLKEALLQ